MINNDSGSEESVADGHSADRSESQLLQPTRTSGKGVKRAHVHFISNYSLRRRPVRELIIDERVDDRVYHTKNCHPLALLVVHVKPAPPTNPEFYGVFDLEIIDSVNKRESDATLEGLVANVCQFGR